MENVFIRTIDCCSKRKLDGKRFLKYFVKNGYKIVSNPKKADYILIITCGFSSWKTNLAFEKIKEYKKYKNELIIAGCVPETDKQELKKIFNGLTISTKILNNNPEKIDEIFPNNSIKFCEIKDTNIKIQNKGLDLSLNNLTRYFSILKFYILHKIFKKYKVTMDLISGATYTLRISWGCMNKCSYCAIKNAVGKYHSKPINQCIDEFKRGLKNGYKKFIIEADNTGCYGIDIDSSFPELLDELTKISGNYSIVIKELHPMWIVKYYKDLENIFKRKKIIILEIPIQSLNERILKLMNRYSNVEKIKEVLMNIKNDFPDIAIITHFMIGFPTETWEEFNQTLSFFKKVNFYSIDLLSFSEKEGTDAFLIEPKIDSEEKNKRYDYAEKTLRSIGYTTFPMSKSRQKIPENTEVYLIKEAI